MIINGIERKHGIPKNEVLRAWEQVKAAGGCAGYDEMTIKDVDQNLSKELYKVWNRICSGSYMAQPVLLYSIPKIGGGVRVLGIPTVTDRIAQMVFKNKLEGIFERVFHPDSDAYRPNHSAIEAVGKVRNRCFKYKWVIDLDIKGFFDNLDHDLLMKMLEKYTNNSTILLYVKRFLKAKAISRNGQIQARDRGTPQGGVISPLLANLYLHEAFDSWMAKKFPSVKFGRYADDIIVHCVSKEQAEFIMSVIERRLKEFKLELNREKSKIVYTGTDSLGKNDRTPRKFRFLGYDFKPRSYKKGDKLKLVFTPGMSDGALKTIRLKICEWKLKRLVSAKIKDIAESVNPKIRGWLNYYGHYRRSSLHRLARLIDSKLLSWIRAKYKKARRGGLKAWNCLNLFRKVNPRLFVHWHMISGPTRAV